MYHNVTYKQINSIIIKPLHYAMNTVVCDQWFLSALWCWMLYVCNMKCDAYNVKLSINISAPMQPYKLLSSAYHCGHVSVALKG
jgi:hypothetical protein